MRILSTEQITQNRIQKFIEIVTKHGLINQWKIVREMNMTPKQYEMLKPLLIQGYDDVLEFHNGNFSVKKVIQNEDI